MRKYLVAWPDIRGQHYERSPLDESSVSPIETAEDVRGATGYPGRFGFTFGWDFLNTEQAVDVEHAALLCADGAGLSLPFVEWEVTDDSDYETDGFALFPGRFTDADFIGDPLTLYGPFPWLEFTVTSLSIGGVTIDPSGYSFTTGSPWTGGMPVFSILRSAIIAAGWNSTTVGVIYARVSGRRIRKVTTNPDTYVLDKTANIITTTPLGSTEQWSASVSVTEKHGGVLPGFASDGVWGDSSVSVAVTPPSPHGGIGVPLSGAPSGAGADIIGVAGPLPPLLTVSGPLPPGVSFINNGDGTGSIAGIPSSGSIGAWPLIAVVQGDGGVRDSVAFTLAITPAFFGTTLGAAPLGG